LGSGYRRLVPACFKPEELLAEVDGLAGREGVGGPAVLRGAVRRYLESLRSSATPRMAVYDVRGGGAGGRRVEGVVRGG